MMVGTESLRRDNDVMYDRFCYHYKAEGIEAQKNRLSTANRIPSYPSTPHLG
jgi:hypothetical protein